jgi:hypothetical protein
MLGLSWLSKRVKEKNEAAQKALSYTTQWVDSKYRDGGRITARDYQEFLNGLGGIEREGVV